VKKQTQQYGGFTLVELMAASVITAFIAMVAVGGMISVTSARSSLDEVTEVMDELRYAADLLRQDLASVHRDRQEMLFEGAVEDSAAMVLPRLRFRAIGTTKARSSQPESDVYEVEYLFVTGQDGKNRLCRRVCPIVGIEDQDDQTAGGILTKLSEHIAFFGIRYFGGTDWSSVWSVDQQLLPTLIEVSLASCVVDKNGKEKIYSKQVIVTFSRLGDQADQLEEEDQTLLEEIEFTDPQAGVEP
jgi:type II secretory pathway pseudopilin PulG